MNNIQQAYGAKCFLVQERRQNVCLKNVNLIYKFLCKTKFKVYKVVFVGNINFLPTLKKIFMETSLTYQ